MTRNANDLGCKIFHLGGFWSHTKILFIWNERKSDSFDEKENENPYPFHLKKETKISFIWKKNEKNVSFENNENPFNLKKKIRLIKKTKICFIKKSEIHSIWKKSKVRFIWKK